ncbi:MAG: GyrI-like domain-containing protein, partial [Treponema sp.]|nr:GyrI-like domain-containing protein [Treponema sp.]
RAASSSAVEAGIESASSTVTKPPKSMVDKSWNSTTEGMKLFTFPKLEWAKFKCFGPLPTALQDLNTKIFREWLPGNAEYEMSAGFNIEYYTKGENGPNYESGIWFPIKKK